MREGEAHQIPYNFGKNGKMAAFPEITTISNCIDKRHQDLIIQNEPGSSSGNAPEFGHFAAKAL